MVRAPVGEPEFDAALEQQRGEDHDQQVGTLAMTEKSATSRTCSRPLPPTGERAARRIASRRATSTISAMAGTRLATSSAATSGGRQQRVRAAACR